TTFYQTGPNGLFIFYQVFNLILQSARKIELSIIKNSEILSIDNEFRNFFAFGKFWYKRKVIKAV
ncbi:hypothetical protein, partial [Lactobacillus johnsonii]|uniref:hypothetical protein n=1 Tax=Lactobacillus johnsonii TaxID=33959 RepID=UPI0019D1CB2A